MLLSVTRWVEGQEPQRSALQNFRTAPKATCLFFFFERRFLLFTEFSVFQCRNIDFQTLLGCPAHATADPKRTVQKFHNGDRWMEGGAAAWRYATQVCLCKRKNRAVQRYTMGRAAEIPNVQRCIFWTVQKETCFFFFFFFFFLPTFRTFY